jgi:hypothetical protein
MPNSSTNIGLSANKREPKFLATLAHVTSSVSKSPLVIALSVKRVSGLFCSLLERSIKRIKGTAPASRIQVAGSIGKALELYQLFEKYTHAVVQLPVFALFPKTNWWGRIIAGTYADEFAEHHLHQLPVREYLGMFVPSAGTGFAIRRDVAERLVANGPLFTEGALTEDYEFAYRLWKIGCSQPN